MNSNYLEITSDNIRRRGEDFDDIGSFVAEQLYSDRTHFIYELLQNAEDALARRLKSEPDSNFPKSVTFKLYPDRLEVSHFGEKFSEKDVRAISDILRGTKKDNNKQIGKFGIGFKSVYAFTSTPKIHSGDEHFQIERFIRLSGIEARELLEGQTLFIFPFNHHSESQLNTFNRINNFLSSLKPRILIFLRNIEEISWSVENNNGQTVSGYYRRESEQIDVVSIKGKNPEKWLIFSKSMPNTNVEDNVKVEVAFLLGHDQSTGAEQIIPVNNGSPLFVYFPTEIETELKFLIQGQYRTTPARDNILRDDDFNKNLIALTATLIAEVLPKIRERGLLTVSFLNILPIRKSDFEKNSLFLPIFDEVKSTFQQKKLLPTIEKGEYVSSQHAKLARSKDLRQLLAQKQLMQLFQGNYRWLSDEITLGKTPDIYTYIKDELKIQVVEPEEFGRQLNKSFVEQQTDEWLAEFYAFLNSQAALWRSDGVLRKKAFIRLEDKTHVAPFNRDLPNAYIVLSQNEKTEFPIVARAIISNKAHGKDALRFLLYLGLSQPDVFDEVMSKTIPKYEQGIIKITDTIAHEENISKIIQALKHVSVSNTNKDKKEKLISRLKQTPFLRAVNFVTNRKIYKKPGDKIKEIIYFPSPELEVYFKDNPDIWFLDETSAEKEQFSILGVLNKVKVVCRVPEADGNIIIKSSRSNHQRGLRGFDPNCEIDGLEFALSNPTVVKSTYIWNNLLKDNIQHISGEIQSSTTKTFTNPEPPIRMVSKLGNLVCNKAWLPDKKGKFHVPSNLSLDDLSGDIIKSPVLAKSLEVKPAKSLQELEAQLFKRFKKKIKFELLDYVMNNPETIERLIHEEQIKSSQQAKTHHNTKNENQEEADLDYLAALREAFNQPGQTELLDSHLPLAPIPDPKDRESKVKSEIRDGKKQEPFRVERFKKVPVNQWESKNTEFVRGFLKNTYGGNCQICDATFPKRDGTAYFEGLYIVSFSKARWIDRPGNVLCLCANCCAKFQHGSVEVNEDILEQISRFKPHSAGGSTEYRVSIQLCGEPAEIRFNERHMIEMQQLIEVAAEDDS
ncbi:MAG: hypothetical protein KME29_32980 [Calothrix sp. FI2-JRJ7]|jgi:hypothetical protein|nr:hypothetical protein [Calothrix sp. FI2-JRJ7]